MKYHHEIRTNYFHLNVIHSTPNGLQHGYVTRCDTEIRRAIEQSNEHLIGLLRSIEKQHHDELEKVGK